MEDKKTQMINFPVIVEKDESEFYVAECPLFEGCYTQGKSLEEALKNLREVIELCLEEKEEYPKITDIGIHILSVPVPKNA